MNKKKLMFWAGMAVSIGFICYAAANMDFRRAFESMMNIRAGWLIPLTSVFLLQFYLRALRLKYITDPLKAVPLGTLFSSIGIGFMGNMVLPMRAGELLRVYVVVKKENLGASGVVATVLVERLFDMLSLM
ncbi:MAG: flippase-like domain-containing protein, partial [Nitrospinae bacterium]|nr:flippase-like domain-containing protein [Nitrospinota bacterium]